METPEVNEYLTQAEKKCNDLIDNTSFENIGQFCEAVFDGLLCWPKTPVGVTANQSCPSEMIKTINKEGFVTKQCMDDGEWFVQPSSHEQWSNYTQCGGFYIEKISRLLINETSINEDKIYSHWLPIIKTVTHFGYILSITSLVIALIIFINIKRLHCARNKLHMHLFISFVLRALMSLIKDGLFVKGTALPYDTVYANGEPTFIKDNYSWICKAIISLRHYFIVSNYMFLLMEGTYLHNLMFLNLFSDSGVTIYCLLGWALPVIFIIPWIVLKAQNENIYCWTRKTSKYIAFLIDVPIGVSVIVNFLLFIIIVRVLFVKLTSMYIQQKRLKYRKLLRSTLILVPLFGIPYTISLILSFHVSHNLSLEIIWLFFDQTFTSFQGFFASTVYCLMNGEVQFEIKRKYNSFKDRNNKEFKRSRTISHTQQMTLNEELQEFQLENGKKPESILKKESDYF